jgi:ABC-type transport system involved in cytochrome bd biosynthesis fused ATPase/permease subunit
MSTKYYESESAERIIVIPPRAQRVTLRYESPQMQLHKHSHTRNSLETPQAPDTEERPKTQHTDTEADPIEGKRIYVQLTWNNVFVWPKASEKCASCLRSAKITSDEHALILKGVSGNVLPGQFLTIIGSTGAGKTTLLQYLSGKMFPHSLRSSGSIQINGVERDRLDYSLFTAFVQQDDILMETLTVRESLEFAANVKCAGDEELRRHRVQDLIHELELESCANVQFRSSSISK